MTAKEHIEELQREFWNDAVGGAYSGSQGGAAGAEGECMMDVCCRVDIGVI